VRVYSTVALRRSDWPVEESEVPNLLSKLPIFRWHEASVHVPRIHRLANVIAELKPRAESILDIGCGDGSMVRELAGRVGASHDMHGVDVLMRANTVIDVRLYDGRTLPFPDGRFDLITLCDVVHHADHPNELLREALRVLSQDGTLVIKDHFLLGNWSKAMLLAMDLFGNYASGVHVEGRYLTPPQWVDIIARAGGEIEKIVSPFRVHNLPWRLLARSDYQFVMCVKHAR